MSRQKSNYRPNPTDFYPTPSWCYKNLQIEWRLFDAVHEPCRGDKRLYNWLKNRISTATWTEITEGRDFFDWQKKSSLIITNPPFSQAKEFIVKALSLADTVIMLLRLNFLGSQSRHNWWKQNPPTALHVLSQRPSFTGNGTDATDYAWFIWDRTGRIARSISFVPIPSTSQLKVDNLVCATSFRAQNKVNN